jgi:SAM-dependent methyltransferase
MQKFSKNPAIDNGRPFNWGSASEDYAIYRDIYPNTLFEKLHELGIGNNNQTIIDLGTGTGIVPFKLKRFGGKFFGVDISVDQINQAKKLSNGDNSFEWIVAPAEQIGLPDSIADVVMACQCFFYFDKSKVIPEIIRLLKPNGIFAEISMIWLPFEDSIAQKTEEIILKYNPDWTGANHKRRDLPLQIPEWSKEAFTTISLNTYDAQIPFTQDTWRGRIRACRGIGASSISNDLKHQFDIEFKAYMEENMPKEFTILHQILIEIFKPITI